MRKMLLPLVSVAALTLAGCNAPSSSQSAGGPATAGSSASAKTANEVSGTITVHGPQVSSNAVLVLNLMDVSSSAAGTAPLATKTAPAGSFPQSFKLTFNPAQVKPADLYVVKAILTDGDRHYSMPIQAPVLTNGSPHDGVKIDLVAQQTPGEKAQAKFDAERKQIGGMKMSHGTKLEPDASRGWQVFRKDKDIAFIRELVDYGKKGFTSTDYAYKDGKVWAIEQKTKPSQGAKATAVDTAIWDDSGNLVVKQHKAGSDTTPLDDDAVAKLKKQSQEILSLAKNSK